MLTVGLKAATNHTVRGDWFDWGLIKLYEQ